MLVANPLVGTRPVEPVPGDVDETTVAAGVDDIALPGTELDTELSPPGDEEVVVVLPDPVGPALLKG